MKCNYITIEREYGSGGTKIARRLAEVCSIACYGPEILEAVSKKNNVPVEHIQHYEESVSGSFLYTLFVMSQVQSGDSDMLTKEGHIFLDEQKEIQRLASSGPAIFLGHCASEALKKRSGVVKVFIRADSDEKKKRIMRDYGIAEKDVEHVRKRFDNKRSKYYYANTTKRWSDMKNYDIVLDSSRLGIDGCVRVLKGLFQQ
ncbi:MAG TPA: cytidylate kinase-like family protein [Candidatus Scybalocola faecigallinarum]|uniref:Cytidylate kinase-like family protein n=1 Tax=Candidatus Scybalocola faecigallinarum TaxID=2840941 RepID=A0A9D1F4T6_9FIRM|nr:cytidylate kinase-like family protein [Candidatus Scybalocola faecigallinarum]